MASVLDCPCEHWHCRAGALLVVVALVLVVPPFGVGVAHSVHCVELVASQQNQGLEPGRGAAGVGGFLVSGLRVGVLPVPQAAL